MPFITVQEVITESVVKGRSKYEVATVTYTTDRGENKQKKVMSFSNPAVFAVAKGAISGQQYEITYTPGDQYYNWATMKAAGGDAPAATPGARAPAAAGSTPVKSTYETPEERKIKQMYIIKQSSIASAIELLTAGLKPGSDRVATADVLNVAQEFVDFVYGTEETLAEMDPDIPY